MNLWTYAVAAGLATAALVDAAKVVLPQGLGHPAYKTWAGLATAGTLSAGWLYWGDWATVIVVWALAWGISRMTHSLTSTLQTIKDWYRRDLRRSTRR